MPGIIMRTIREDVFFIMEAVDINKAVLALIGADGEIIAKQEIKFSVGNIKLLKRISDFLKKQKINFSDISGIITVAGPGSFTSIRTSLSIVNTWAAVESIPVVGLSRQDLAGRSVPPIVTQIADGENGGVMMNEFPPHQRPTRTVASRVAAYTCFPAGGRAAVP